MLRMIIGGSLLTLLGLILVLGTVRCTRDRRPEGAGSSGGSAPPDQADGAAPAGKPGETALRQRLTPLQYDVTQNEATEPPFRNEYWDNHEEGLYVDVVSGEPLFSSADKFESGTGWPSFTRPLVDGNIVSKEDRRLFRSRTEVRSRGADSHLGHVFDDGPAPTGRRYCINSASLRFVPANRLAEEGYGQYAGLFGMAAGPAGGGTEAASARSEPEATTQAAPAANSAPGRETATLAGGCFWGMEEIIRKIPGVLGTQVGYTGGTLPDATYPDVKTGRTGHAESVQIVFDPAQLAYEDLLGWFFRMHDPTTSDRQGNDVGSQYRSAIFYHSEEQRLAAERVKARVDASGKWARPVVTGIEPAGPFYSAEEYHQDYLQKNPNGYTCHFLRD